MMDFQVDDYVVHWPYGLGKIIQLDEKELSGQTLQYYVIQVRDVTIWAPIASENGGSNLRKPASAGEFEQLFTILSAPPEPLSDDRVIRRNQLGECMKGGNLELICRAIRDMMLFRREKKMNDYDKSFLERAINFLLAEWAFSLSISVDQARAELKQLLKVETIPTRIY